MYDMEGEEKRATYGCRSIEGEPEMLEESKVKGDRGSSIVV
jgi:hypothetical protein